MCSGSATIEESIKFADVAMITGAVDSDGEAVVVVVVVDEPDTPSEVSCEGGQEHIFGEGVALAISATGAADIGVSPGSPGESGEVGERVVTVQGQPPSSDDN